MNTVLLPAACLPPVSWLMYAAGGNAFVEVCDHYQKQSYRSRYRVLTAAGVRDLVIPVEHSGNGSIPLSEVRICYRERWQQQHWRTIYSAYKNAPYFDFYAPDLEPWYTRKTERLLDFSRGMITLCCTFFSIPVPALTTLWEKESATVLDLRERIHPKKASPLQLPTYTQVFSDRFAFQPDLSALDLLFNAGPKAEQLLPGRI